MRLVIDSATAACSVAMIDGVELIAESHEIVGRGHAERLVPAIRDLIGRRRPDAILVDCGPGSFTGIRVGLAAAHGLAIGWGIPLFGYSSMALLAAGAEGDDDEVAVAVGGGHGELFVQTYARPTLAALDALQSLTPADAAASISADRVVGSGAEALVAARGWGRPRDGLPRAADARKLPPDLTALAPRPIYGRAPDAVPA